MAEKSQEVNYKKGFCQQYFDRDTWELDVLNQVDVLLHNRKGQKLLYIESKHHINNMNERQKALAQLILTNKKQDEILDCVALIYQDVNGIDVMELVDCSDNSVMYNNDINWDKEKPSSPTRDAIDRINDRLRGRITTYRGDEIKQCYSKIKKGQDIVIDITLKNVNVVYNQWKNNVHFQETIGDEQELINLFLADLLKNQKYKQSVFHDIVDHNLFETVKVGEREDEVDKPLIREGTNLSQYKIMYDEGEAEGIRYTTKDNSHSVFYSIADHKSYNDFWRKYKRPPAKKEFLKILERSATLYSEQYRRTTGGEYTPSCFVEKQVEILQQHYDLDEFIVMDPCAGVGNLENQFGKEYKQYCYLSTLEQMDVGTCRIKGFENSIQYDYLKNDEQPRWRYRGQALDIGEICRREGRKLMVIMNPPYQLRKGHKDNMAIEFFKKVMKLQPQVLVFYYATQSFLRDEIENYINSGYYIQSHIISNARTTFHLSEWPISQIIFDREEGMPISKESIKVDRYEVEHNGTFVLKGTYTYNTARPNLFRELQQAIREKATGMVLGNVSYLNDVIKIGNGGIDRKQHCTVDNLKLCLLSKGLIFNTHHHYFELNSNVYRGEIEDISNELVSDAIMFSQFYIGILFSNKGQRNFIMPFTSEELGCGKNDLNVLFPQDQANLFSIAIDPFDFRKFFHSYSYSQEAKELYQAALEVFRFYHRCPDYASGRDWNDSYYDITNTIMGKDTSRFGEMESASDHRITRVKTTKGTRGFGRNNIKYVVPSADLPIFINFFDARDRLAQKINDQLVEAGLLLWKRENLY